MQGLIIGNISNKYKVKVDKDIYDCNARGKFRLDEISPVVGDNVEIEVVDENKNEAIIEKIYDRKSYIKRPKVANIAQIIFVISIKNPKPDLLMLDKQLAYAEFLGLKSIIVINKIDLETDFKEIEDTYSKIGYEVYPISAKKNTATEKLRDTLKNTISAFSGNSGVGKSTIINCLFSKDITLEGEISIKNKKGKNTTTDIKLYELEENTYIVDTPGFSSFDIYEIESKDLDKYFVDFKGKIKDCEFVGCTHIKEKNCGIKKAIENNELDVKRYDRFCKIYEELKQKEARRW